VKAAQNSTNGRMSALSANLGTTSSGNALIAAVSWDNASNATVSLDDNNANSGWTPVTTKQTDARHAQSMQMFYLPRITTGGAAHSVTAHFSGGGATHVRLIVHEVAGLDPSGSLQQVATVNNERGAPVAVGPVTSASSKGYVFAAIMNDSQPGGTSIEPDGNAARVFSERATAAPGNNEMQSQDLLLSTSASVTSNWTMSATNDAIAQVATFKAAP
jgi:hypothetical protein